MGAPKTDRHVVLAQVHPVVGAGVVALHVEPGIDVHRVDAHVVGFVD